MFQFQLDSLDIHHKPAADSSASSEVEETVTNVQSSSTAPTTRPITLMLCSPTLTSLTPTPQHLAHLQITFQKQPTLDQLDRYFNRQNEVLKEQQTQGQDPSSRPSYSAPVFYNVLLDRNIFTNITV